MAKVRGRVRCAQTGRSLLGPALGMKVWDPLLQTPRWAAPGSCSGPGPGRDAVSVVCPRGTGAGGQGVILPTVGTPWARHPPEAACAVRMPFQTSSGWRAASAPRAPHPCLATPLACVRARRGPRGAPAPHGGAFMRSGALALCSCSPGFSVHLWATPPVSGWRGGLSPVTAGAALPLLSGVASSQRPLPGTCQRCPDRRGFHSPVAPLIPTRTAPLPPGRRCVPASNDSSSCPSRNRRLFLR